MKNKSVAAIMKKYVPYFFKVLYFFIIGELLLLISAIAEKGETEFSCALLPDRFAAEEMIESIIAAALILFVGRMIFDLIFLSDDT